MDKNTEFKKQSKIIENFVSAFAKMFALFSEEAFIFLELIQNKAHLKSIEKIPSTQEWLEFYKNENSLIQSFFKHFTEDFADTEFPSHNLEPFYDFLSLTDKENISEDELSKLKLSFYKTLEIFTEFFKNGIEFCMKNHSQQNSEEKYIFQDNAFLFMIAVYLPCNLYYGKKPNELYEKAQKGSIEDIKKLLRIDPSVLGDSLIFEHLHTASMDEERSNFNDMVYSLGHPPKEKITLQQIKFKAAGIISSASERLKQKLNSTEIEMIFDALSKELNREELKLVEIDDPNKVPYNKSITQKIRRSKNFWE